MLRSTAPSGPTGPLSDSDGDRGEATAQPFRPAPRYEDAVRPQGFWRERLPWWLRGLTVVAGSVAATLLTIAFFLTPNTSGMETHRQLGLAPCASVQLFGIRCPSCGMTTSWSHLTKGQIVGALSANAGGTLFGLLAMVSAPYLIVAGLMGRWPLARPHEAYVALAAGSVFVVTLIDWGVRLTGLV